MQKETLEMIVQLKKDLEKAATALLTQYQIIRKKILNEDPDKYLSFYSLDIETMELIYSGEEYWSFGGHEYHSLKLPASWLYELDAIDQISKQASNEKLRKEEKDRIAKEQEEAEEKAQLAKLKKKYKEKE